ncbi:MAG: DEAD/DEAH box helicase [Candidatus Omnitrophica bacterium]|nr:DEAD/DEAH box helicase [Candidatus Omnitrophota bacterium]
MSVPMLDCCRLYVGERVDVTGTLAQLLRFGYRRVEQVADPGDVALRGGVLDVFPATFECPLRVELHGSRILSIRSFNPVSAETLDRHSMVVILPCSVAARAAGRDDISPERPALLRSPEAPFEGSLDLSPGDLVVHVDHGIGRFAGRATLPMRHGQADALILEYADGDRLYVPMDQLHLVQKYVGFGVRAPRLHKLGGQAWERAKDRAYISAWSYAKNLLEVQAKRLALPGFAFPPDHEWQRVFERAFPYRATPDQLAAIADVKRDMETAVAMDRLLLGDVGYGKTEVALRAACKAVTAQKQVAVLVPTTVLAYQHYRTFAARMASLPVTVEMLSRFQSEAEQRRVIEGLRTGRCDIVIGTHRLLSDDIEFTDLRLLIVDEEQRFGVRDKEQLKRWRSQLDVLTLSATPIPRTLYLALMGSRQMSLITTPPEHRHPVETIVAEDDEASLGRWIRQELARQGQVYVVYNRVRSIHRVAARMRELVPEARIGIGHGQMAEEALARTVADFIDGRVDVLVTTTIIESGIDIPNANTMIIMNAHQFGLSELYQLRGRVGRFTRKAYAYLVVPHGAVLTEESRSRLQAIASHTALGSGFTIAMEDLKLRGAGNILGPEQHGHITAVGFDYYCRLLRDAVQHLRQRQLKEGEQA